MRGVEFTFDADDGFVRAEWAPAAGWGSFPKAWDWRLELDGEQVNSSDTYSGTASLGELVPGLYSLRIRAKQDEVVAGVWRDERHTTFRVAEGDRVVGETELMLSRILDRVGALFNQRDALQQLLDEALQDLEVARSTIQVLALQLESLRALGSQPSGGAARRVWRALASPAVATIVAITAIPVGAFVGIEAAQIQAQATLEVADQQSDLDDHMAACLENTEKLIEALGAMSSP
jgi:hypothetical protein